MLSVSYAGALLASGELASVEGRLDDAERQVTSLTAIEAGASTHAAEIAFVEEGELRRVPGQIEMYRTALAQVRGDVWATVEHAQRVLAIATEDDYVARGGSGGIPRDRLVDRGGPAGGAAGVERGALAGSGGRATSPMPSVPPSHWATSAWHRGASGMR